MNNNESKPQQNSQPLQERVYPSPEKLSSITDDVLLKGAPGAIAEGVPGHLMTQTGRGLGTIGLQRLGRGSSATREEIQRRLDLLKLK